MRKYLNVEYTEWQCRSAFLKRLSENQDGISVSSALLLPMGTDRVANWRPDCQMKRRGDGGTRGRGDGGTLPPFPASAAAASKKLSVLAWTSVANRLSGGVRTAPRGDIPGGGVAGVRAVDRGALGGGAGPDGKAGPRRDPHRP